MSNIGKLYASLYNKCCGKHPVLYPWHFQWLAVRYLYRDLQRILPGLHGKVLDVGCGGKPYKVWLSKEVRHVGIDIYDGDLVDHVIEPGEPWPIDDISMDAVLCTQVLEHTKNVETVLDEIQRVLKPGGTLIISVPFMYQEHGAPNDFHRFSYYGLLSLVSEKYEVLEGGKQGGIGSSLGILLLGWVETVTNSNLAIRLAKGFLFPVWVLFSAVVNLICAMLDRLDMTDSFYSNAYILAKKK